MVEKNADNEENNNEKTSKMKAEESKLLSLFENYKGHSSNLFDNEEWREFDAFCAGYNLKNK